MGKSSRDLLGKSPLSCSKAAQHPSEIVWGRQQEQSSSSHPSQDDDAPTKEVLLPASQEQVNRQQGHPTTEAAGWDLTDTPSQRLDPELQFMQ